jgi:hypothetical protein
LDELTQILKLGSVYPFQQDWAINDSALLLGWVSRYRYAALG